jgi:putative ABC transport system substrate-binding protein
MITEWFPNAKTVGLLYCSKEANSQYQVDVVKAELEKKGLTATLYPFTDSNDLAQICTTAADNCDVIYVPTDNTVAENTGIIDNVCAPKKVPVIAGEEGICKGCGVATLSISYYDLGYATGKMSVKVLTGEADISTLAIGYAETQTPKYNKAICDALGITPLEGYVAIEDN